MTKLLRFFRFVYVGNDTYRFMGMSFYTPNAKVGDSFWEAVRK
jgi:hypothetical protein